MKDLLKDSLGDGPGVVPRLSGAPVEGGFNFSRELAACLDGRMVNDLRSGARAAVNSATVDTDSSKPKS